MKPTLDLVGKWASGLRTLGAPITGGTRSDISRGSIWRALLLLLAVAHGSVGSAQNAGAPDPLFASGAGANATVSTLLVLPDERVLVGGYFTSFEGHPRVSLVRLTQSGAVDPSFAPTGANGGVIALARQSDGKIIAGGEFTVFGGQPANRLVRLEPDGALDSSFDAAAGVAGTATPAVMTLAVGPDDRVVVGGFFTHVNGAPQPYVARLDKDGKLDTSWQPQLPVTDYDGVLSVQVLPDNRGVLVGGQFELINGVAQRSLALLKPDGTLATTFRPEFSKPSAVFEICPAPHDSLLVGGYFVEVNGVSRRGIARLQADGSLDKSFAPGLALDHQVNALAVQRDGKILAGGYFTDFDQHAVSRLVRLLPDGSFDATFQVWPGIAGGDNPGVLALAVQGNGGILVGGEFTTVQGMSRNRIARVFGDLGSALPRPFTLQALGLDEAGFHLKLLGEPGRRYTVERSSNAVDWTEWTHVTAETEAQTLTDADESTTSWHFYRAWTP